MLVPARWALLSFGLLFAISGSAGCVRARIGARAAVRDGAADRSSIPDLGPGTDATPGGVLSSHVRGGPGLDRVRAMVLDAAGNLYLAGSFRGTVRLGSSDLAARGPADAFVASFDPAGQPRWAIGLGSDEIDEATGVAVDDQGRVAVVGYSAGTFFIGGQPFDGKGGEDIFVAALDASDGRLLWGRVMGGAGDDRATSVSVAANGDLTVAGFFSGAVDFGTGTLATPQTSIGGFIARYARDGSPRWAQRIASDGALRVMAIADAGSDRLYAAGSYEGELTLGNLAPLACAGATDIFVTALASSDGHAEWLRGLGGPGIDGALALAAIEAGPVVTGRFSAAVSFGGNPVSAAGLDDVFVARFDGGGGLVWSHTFGSGGTDSGRALAIGLDRVYLSGAFSGSIFPIGAGTKLSSAGGEDLFVAAYRYVDGDAVWARRFGGLELDGSDAIAQRNRRLVVGGSYSDTVDFGDGPHTSAGATDLFWLELAP